MAHGMAFLWSLLAWVSLAAGFSEVHSSPHGTVTLQRLRFCNDVLGDLQHSQELELRDAIQDLEHHMRLFRQYEVLLDKKNNPPSDIKWQYAYNTSMSKEELESRVEAARKASRSYSEKLTTMIDALSNGPLKTKDLQHISNCIMAKLNTHRYPHQPVVSFMLQYFKRPWMVQPIIERLSLCNKKVPSEVVVNVDEPSDHQLWAELAYNTSGFVVPVFSANIHEIRAYNRLADLARGKYIIIMQDDEKMAPDCSWLEDVVSVFEHHPLVGVVGLKEMRLTMEWDNKYPSRAVMFRDPTTKVPFQYVAVVDFAPMALRKATYKSVGGLDETMSEPGECGIKSDWEICLRMWSAGWQVAYYHMLGAEADQSGVDSGTHKPETGVRCWEKQHQLAGIIYDHRWGGDGGGDPKKSWHYAVGQEARRLNLQTLEKTFSECPYGPTAGGCDML